MFVILILALVAVSVTAKFADRVDDLFPKFVKDHSRVYEAN